MSSDIVIILVLLESSTTVLDATASRLAPYR